VADPAAAGRRRRERLATARLYLCTGARPDLEPFLDAVLGNGVDLVQLREKRQGTDWEAADELAWCPRFAAAAARHGALWSVNDRADVACAAGPDILHLGQRDLPVAVARRILGDGTLIGLSTHAPAEVDAAAADPDVDYFCVGPVWTTPTKPGRPAAGLDLVRYAAGLSTGKPWFAIGGIGADTLDEVLAAGARRVVVVRALTGAADPAGAARAARALAARLADAAAG
jgi:thiamine-phosphate pyrophosphorylase